MLIGDISQTVLLYRIANEYAGRGITQKITDFLGGITGVEGDIDYPATQTGQIESDCECRLGNLYHEAFSRFDPLAFDKLADTGSLLQQFCITDADLSIAVQTDFIRLFTKASLNQGEKFLVHYCYSFHSFGVNWTRMIANSPARSKDCKPA